MAAPDTQRLTVRELGASGLRIALREGTVDGRAVEPWIAQLGGEAPNPLGLPVDGTILDVGAHVGGFTLPAARMVPKGRVLAVEACRESYELLARNVTLNGLANVETAHLALAGHSGELNLHHDPEGNWGHNITRAMGHGDREVVAARTLAEFLAERRIERCDLAKFNCEGAEFPILMAAAPETLARIDLMLILYHCDLVEEPYDLEGLESQLRAAGFAVERFPTSATRGRIIARRLGGATVESATAIEDALRQGERGAAESRPAPGDGGALAAEIRSRLGPPPTLPDWPLVSIVVLNRDGAPHLRRLLAGLVEHTAYPRLELIVVDNGSSDESVDFLRRVEAPFAISIIANHHNESFSDANNQGAELASGELLLLLNNDIEPFERGWLRELVACYRRSGAGAVGATLLCRNPEGSAPAGYGVQTGPVRLREKPDETIAVDPHAGRSELFDDSFGREAESVIVIGACMLIDRRLFEQIGGFTPGYVYGGEDEDLCLKLRERGHRVLYSGRSHLVHHSSSTTRQLHRAAGGATRQANGRLLAARWGRRAWRERQLDLDAQTGVWAGPDEVRRPGGRSREQILALGFCLVAGGAGAAGERWLKELGAELTRRGHRRIVLQGDAADDPRSVYYDVVVYVRGTLRHIPREGQMNVLLDPGAAQPLSATECRRYDLVVASDAGEATRLGGASVPILVLALEGGDRAGDLVDAALRRAEQIELPTRIQGPAHLIHYWHDADRPERIAETLAGFKRHNPDLEQLEFDEDSAERFIAAHYGAREVSAFRACAVPAMQADYFRYCAIHTLGGVYADANFRCAGSVRPQIEGSRTGTLFGRQDPVPDWLAAEFRWPYPVGHFRAVVNSMFGFRASGHPLLELAIRVATANTERRVADGPVGVWLTTGPGIFTSAYLLRELGSFDAFLEYAAGSILEPSANLFCETVGDYDTLGPMWRGVRIEPLGAMEASGVTWGRKVSATSNWKLVDHSIFR